MSLTLNDEQARELRAWWVALDDNMRNDPTLVWGHIHSGNWERLHAALAPLMKPWRSAPYELGWLIGNGKQEFYINPHGVLGHHERQVAMQRVLDTLNESEARR